MDVKDLLASSNPFNTTNELFCKSNSIYAQKSSETLKSTGAGKSKKPKKKGFVRATGRDSADTLRRMLRKLDAKFSEVNKSNADSKIKDALLMDIRQQMNKLEALIHEVKQKEIRQAAEESKKEQEKRKQRTESKSLLIKKGYLYSAKDGGTDPSDYVVSISGSGNSAAQTGVQSAGAAAELPGSMDLAADISMASADVDISL